MLGWLTILGGIGYVIYKCAEQNSWDNCNAHDVDWKKMSYDQAFISKSEMKRRYKSGYYNKK